MSSTTQQKVSSAMSECHSNHRHAHFLIKVGIFVAILLNNMGATAQEGKADHRALAWADSVYQAQLNQAIAEPTKTLPVLDSVLTVFTQSKDLCRASHIHSWRSHCFEFTGQTDSAVAVAQRALQLFHPGCDSLVLMSIHVTLSNAWLALGEYMKVQQLTETSLRNWNEKWPYSITRNGLYTNRAIALAYQDDLDGALQAFRDVLANARKEGVVSNELNALQNMVAHFGWMGIHSEVQAYRDSAEHYQQRAMNLARSIDDKKALLRLYVNTAILNSDLKKYEKALVYLDSAQVLADALKNLRLTVKIADVRSQCLFLTGRADSAYKVMRVHKSLQDTLLNTEKVKAIADMQERYESEKKAREILGLRADKLQGELEKSKAERTRNIVLSLGFVVLLLAFGLWSRLRYTRRSRAIVQKEKDRSDALLLNILPAEVAEELKDKGEAEARLIDEVTVIFTDFKGFTAMSELVTPKQLVKDLHECFSAFDHICAKYGLEKIKTIGDAYMAAGGLPTPTNDHAVKVIRAALEMRDFVEEGKQRKIANNLPYFEIRIGIHTGPVVAGIVGVKKFQYDIWGDTVNTASRMESSGEVGKVNISEATYELVKDEFNCEFRGEIEAKGKGKMRMLFVKSRK
ncbi:MAG: hypothetical protein EA392_13800 [Cryomorphaceae bacterium]|nr:MAG: hypothetical protein EA392_13800 [Cryomorphaceae bacterium]